MQKPLTDRSQKILTVSEAVARELGLKAISPVCIFIGILRVSESVAHRALIRSNIFSLEYIEFMALASGRPAEPFKSNSRSRMFCAQEAQEVLRYANEASWCDYVGSEHLLLALFAISDAALASLFANCLIVQKQVWDAIQQVLATLAADSKSKKKK